MSRDGSVFGRRRYVRTLGTTLVGVCLAGCGGGVDWPHTTVNRSSVTEPTGSASDAGGDDDPIHEGYETTTVVATTRDGVELGSVTAAIADTPQLRYLGLSDTEWLPEDRGMLFVFDGVDDRTFVMREMDFGIDIVYADESGCITRIHHAPAPGPDEDGASQEYPGRGQYVLEVPLEWTTDRGVEPGHRLDWGE